MYCIDPSITGETFIDPSKKGVLILLYLAIFADPPVPGKICWSSCTWWDVLILLHQVIYWFSCTWWDAVMDEWTIKTPNSICRLFFKIVLLTEFAALCLTDFIDWRYIHSVVCIFDPGCELLPPWMKEQYLCTVAPLLYLLSDLPPPPKLSVHVHYSIYRQCVWLGGMLNCAVDHILQ
jgi:hypothetical protein